jgi:3-oxoacyl-[acyl-carrier protein] reductase
MQTATDLPLKEKVAVVTGASRGIGEAIAHRLARSGATVVCAARTEKDLYQTMELMRAAGGDGLAIPTDVTNDEQLVRLVEQTLARYSRIDILVNNAGGAPPRTPAIKMRRLDWEYTLRVNLWATIYLTQLVLPGMIKQRQGTIINLSSVAGLEGKAGEAAYAAAKFGIRGFSQAVFEEVRRYDVKVSVICPDYVDTALLPPNRRIDRTKLLTPEDIAEAAYSVVIASPRACPTEIRLQPQQDPFTM